MGYLNPHTQDLDDNLPPVVTICGSTRFLPAEVQEAVMEQVDAREVDA